MGWLLKERVDAIEEIFLWPYAGCNHHCVSCDIWRDRSRRELSADEVRTWARDWGDLGVRAVILTGGEPLMHHDLFELADTIPRDGVGVMLLSTGGLLARHAENVVRTCDVVLVSLDGPEPVHNAVRRTPHAFRALVKGMAAVREKDPEAIFFGRCTVHRHNFRYLSETVAAAQELGVNRLSFIPADVTSEAFNRDGGWTGERQDSVVIDVGDLDELSAQVERLIADWPDLFESGMIQESPEHLRKYVRDFYRAHHGLNEFPPVACDRPDNSVVIEVDGTVRPCFFLEPYGNLRTDGSLLEIVNSPAAQKLRSGLDPATHDICRRCPCFRDPQGAATGTAKVGKALRDGEVSLVEL